MIKIELSGGDDSLREQVLDWLKGAVQTEFPEIDWETSDGLPANFETLHVEGPNTVVLEFTEEVPEESAE